MQGQGLDRRVLAVAMLAIAVFVLLRMGAALQAPSLFSDSDDVMRMVSARDLLAEQAFNDSFQYRDNTPFGASMHWSRLIDLPLAGLMGLAAPLGDSGAVTLAALAWPALLLGIFLWLSYRLCRRLAGPAASLPALVLPLLAVPVLTEFAPGRVDHHNVQMLLTGGLALALMAGRRDWRAAGVAGLLAAGSLAIGLETLPFVVLAIGIVGVFVVAEPESAARPARWFALGLGGGTLAAWLVSLPPQQWLVVACDALSVSYGVAGLAASVALVVGAAVAPRLGDWRGRLALMAGLGTVALAVPLGLYPQCLAGPYGALDPALWDTIFPQIEEAQPLLGRLWAAPAVVLALVIAPLAGLVVTVWLVAHERGERRVDWLIVLAFALVALGLTMLQIRGARLAAVFALPPGVWLASTTWARFRAGNSLGAALGVAGSWLAFAGIAHLALAAPLQGLVRSAPGAARAELPASACLDRDNFAGLLELPVGRLLTQNQIGGAVLLYTPHSVVATGFHRNSAGMADIRTVFSGTPEAARAVVARRGIDHVVVCRGVADTGRIMQRLSTEPGWDWLVPVAAPAAALQVFRVVPE